MRKQVTWEVGTEGQPGTPAPRVEPTRHDRCENKIAQIERHLLMLTRQPAVNAGAIRFQQQRLAWLRWASAATDDELDAARTEVLQTLGPTGAAMLRDGVPAGVSDDQKYALAHLAILNFAQGDR